MLNIAVYTNHGITNRRWGNAPLQLISWTFLFASILFLYQGVHWLRKMGGSEKRKTASANYAFENTVNLVTVGIYKYIRHPMYSSLLFLLWGTLLKHVTVGGVLVTLITTGFLMATAKTEERENIAYFGTGYKEYKNGTKMFIPYCFNH